MIRDDLSLVFRNLLNGPDDCLGRLGDRLFNRRNAGRLLCGPPALLVGLSSLVLLAVAYLQQPDRLADRYRVAAYRVSRSQDMDAALLCYERLIELDPREEYTLRLALCAEELNDLPRAGALMAELAPAHRKGLAEAHVWQAQQLLAADTVTDEMHDEAQLHLSRALLDQPDRFRWRALLGQSMLASDKRLDGLRELQLIAGKLPTVQLMLARLHHVESDHDKARLLARQVAPFFREHVKADPHDVQARLNWAESLAVAGEFTQSVSVLQEGLVLREDPRLRTATAQAYLAWSDSVGQSAPVVDVALRIRLLEHGLQADPGNPQILHRLVVAGEHAGDDGQRAEAVLQSLVARGRGTATLHLVLGNREWSKGNHDVARKHLEQAWSLDPKLGVVGNNLAWYLAHSDPPDWARALEIMNSVLLRWPEDPAYLDTRGQILAKMQRWDESLLDLEKALSSTPRGVQLHKTLALVYQQLGMKAMAEQHEVWLDQNGEFPRDETGSLPAASGRHAGSRSEGKELRADPKISFSHRIPRPWDTFSKVLG